VAVEVLDSTKQTDRLEAAEAAQRGTTPLAFQAAERLVKETTVAPRQRQTPTAEAAGVAVLVLLEVRWFIQAAAPTTTVETAVTGWNGPQGLGLTTQAVEAAQGTLVPALMAVAARAAAGTVSCRERPTLAAEAAANLVTTLITVQAAPGL